MKTDASGGASAGDDLENRLSGQFAAELDGAERDYPALREKLVGSVPAARGAARAVAQDRAADDVGRRPGGRGLAGAGLLSGPGTGPACRARTPVPSGPASSGVVMGADGIPTQIDGQRVYRVTDQAEWQT